MALLSRTHHRLVNLSGTPAERVTTFKLLGVHLASDLKWTQRIDAITSKAAPRLHFLKQLKRSGAGRDYLLYNVTVIRTVLETSRRFESGSDARHRIVVVLENDPHRSALQRLQRLRLCSGETGVPHRTGSSLKPRRRTIGSQTGGKRGQGCRRSTVTVN